MPQTKLSKGLGICDSLDWKTLPFLEFNRENIAPNSRHNYYGQVQLTMGILGVTKCDLLVYGSGRDELMIISAPRDGGFTDGMLVKLEISPVLSHFDF